MLCCAQAISIHITSGMDRSLAVVAYLLSRCREPETNLLPTPTGTPCPCEAPSSEGGLDHSRRGQLCHTLLMPSHICPRLAHARLEVQRLNNTNRFEGAAHASTFWIIYKDDGAHAGVVRACCSTLVWCGFVTGSRWIKCPRFPGTFRPASRVRALLRQRWSSTAAACTLPAHHSLNCFHDRERSTTVSGCTRPPWAPR